MKILKNITIKPWGKFYDLAQEHQKWHLKILAIKKGQRLSLQRHRHRSEFWVVAEGKIRVQKNRRVLALAPSESVVIKKNEPHRIEALTNAIVIELSFGRHKETDIMRLADDYGRATGRLKARKQFKK